MTGGGVFYRDEQDRAAREPLVRELWEEAYINPYWELAFILRFVEPVFQDPVESSFEYLVDMDADREWGEVTGPWKDFRPDYRLEVTGQDGGITRIAYYSWDGSRWQPWPDEELRGIEVAAAGRNLEGSISLSVLGSPRIAPHKPGTTDRFIVQRAMRTRQGDSHDYLPLPGFAAGDGSEEWLPFRGNWVLMTAVATRSWGAMKRSR